LRQHAASQIQISAINEDTQITQVSRDINVRRHWSTEYESKWTDDIIIIIIKCIFIAQNRVMQL